MPVSLNPAFIVGLSMFFGGFMVLFIVLAQSGGLAFGFAALTNISKLLSDSERKGLRRGFWVGLSICALGGLVTCGSVMAGDAGRNRGCEKACQDAGFNKGRFRKSPHAKPQPQEPYRCWCQGPEGWGPEAVDVAAHPADH